MLCYLSRRPGQLPTFAQVAAGAVRGRLQSGRTKDKRRCAPAQPQPYTLVRNVLLTLTANTSFTQPTEARNALGKLHFGSGPLQRRRDVTEQVAVWTLRIRRPMVSPNWNGQFHRTDSS
jgi:hypothetical protein